ncbi:hypothetical protein HQ590_01775, partial [bacterium]|nr:hypothetical protein [bacterium]
MIAVANPTTTTYYYERWRAVAHGVIETAGQTFLLLIAVRYFQAGATAKALIASGLSVGFLLSLVTVSLSGNRGWPPARSAARLAALGAVSLLAMFAMPVLPVFVAGSVLAMASVGMAVPFLTQLYQDNYPAAGRGRLFSRTVMIRVLTMAVFSELAGRMLSAEIGRARALLLVYAAAFAFAAWCLARCPS